MNEVNPFAIRELDPRAVRLFHTSPDDNTVRLTLDGDRSFREVRIARAFPFSDPDHFIGLRDGDDKDIGILASLYGLERDSRQIIEKELERRYFTPKVERVISVKEEFGVVSWDVETDRGNRKFAIRNLRDNAYPIGADRVMMTDTDGNRYDFPQISSLGQQAFAVLQKIL